MFKLERERPASCVYENQLYYVKDKFIRMYDFKDGSDVPVLAVRRGAINGVNGSTIPRTLSYNPAEHAVIFCNAHEGGNYEMYMLPRDLNGGEPRDGGMDGKRGTGQSAVFVARNRFAVLDKPGGQVMIKDMRNEVTKQFATPPNCTDVFYAGTKNVLITTTTSVLLYDTELRENVAEINVAGVRHVVWSPDMSMVALLSKHTIVLANRKLEQSCQIHETIKVKSGAWDETGIFLYTTLNHIKYALPQGYI